MTYLVLEFGCVLSAYRSPKRRSEWNFCLLVSATFTQTRSLGWSLWLLPLLIYLLLYIPIWVTLMSFWMTLKWMPASHREKWWITRNKWTISSHFYTRFSVDYPYLFCSVFYAFLSPPPVNVFGDWSTLEFTSAQRDPISGRGNFGDREWDPIWKYNGRMRRAKSFNGDRNVSLSAVICTRWKRLSVREHLWCHYTPNYRFSFLTRILDCI